LKDSRDKRENERKGANAYLGGEELRRRKGDGIREGQVFLGEHTWL
jgi:hypothetical protein